MWSSPALVCFPHRTSVLWAAVCERVKKGYTQSGEMHNWEIWNVGECGEGSFCLADLHRQLASHVSPRLISNQHRPSHAHAQRQTHTHILYPSLRRLCSLMPRLHSPSPSFPLPPPPPLAFCPSWHQCEVGYKQKTVLPCLQTQLLLNHRFV